MSDMRAQAANAKRIRGAYITRFDVHQRVQHALLFSSFAILALTGLPMKYSGSPISVWWMDRVWGGLDTMRAVHRGAAWVMIAVCVYHLLYIVAPLVIPKRAFSAAMLPNLKDVRDFAMEMKYTFGLSKEKPKFDRFSYRNKFAYWVVYGGVFFTVGSGLILMYPVGAAHHLPSWTLALALTVHSDAAILGIGWVIMVHMYFAHFSPVVFPADKSIFTGLVPADRYKHEFPLEYARIMGTSEAPAPVEETLPATVPVPNAQQGPAGAAWEVSDELL